MSMNNINMNNMNMNNINMNNMNMNNMNMNNINMNNMSMNNMKMNNMNNMSMNNMNINKMGMNNNQLFQNNFNAMNQMKGMNNNVNLMNMQMMPMQMMMMNMNMNKNDETKEITNIQEANKVIKELKKENRFLNNKLNRIEEKLKELELFKSQMYLNCYYNQFDLNAYKLDDIFNSINSNIIQQKEEFGLINKGIRHLFNKNIKNFELIFQKVEKDEFDLSTFKNMFDNLTYSVLFVSTKVGNNTRRFGAFINNNLNDNNLTLNPNMNNMNNTRNNSMGNNSNMMNNNGNNNNMMNNMGNNNFPQRIDLNEENIFNSSSSSKKSFVFSFDSLDIYFKEEINKCVPGFSIIYNKRYKSFLGNELPNNPFVIMLNHNNSNQIIPDYNVYKLSGVNEFTINHLELYQIKI